MGGRPGRSGSIGDQDAHASEGRCGCVILLQKYKIMGSDVLPGPKNNAYGPHTGPFRVTERDIGDSLHG